MTAETTKPSILLIEDDQALQDVYVERFRSESFDVVIATDGEEAVKAAIARKPDIILLDLMLPKLSGFDVLDILRHTEETKNIKVVVLSALSQAADIERGKYLGADLYLVKSQVTLSDVVQKIKELLAAKPAHN